MAVPLAERRQGSALPVPLPRSDVCLWVAAVMLTALGIVMVYSASLGEAPHPRVTPAAFRQALFALTGLGLMLAAARLDYRALRRVAAPAYALAILLLVAVLAVGVAEHGARRWLGTEGLTLQPAEFAKPVVALAMAAYMSGRTPRGGSLVTALALALVPMGLVLVQPDLGTVLAFAGCWTAMVLAWGTPWRLLAGVAGGGLALVPVLFAVGVSGYQRERLAVFLDPSRDPLGSGFNLRQAEVAMGSAGLTGEGLFTGGGELETVAARSSDFVFALVGQQLGLLGGLLVIVLLAVVVWRGFSAAHAAPDAFGRLLAVGLTATVLTQAFVNIAVNVRLFPATGIPLPFVSQGGSSLVTMLMVVGLLQSVFSRRAATAREQWRGERWRY